MGKSNDRAAAMVLDSEQRDFFYSCTERIGDAVNDLEEVIEVAHELAAAHQDDHQHASLEYGSKLLARYLGDAVEVITEQLELLECIDKLDIHSKDITEEYRESLKKQRAEYYTFEEWPD